MQKLASRPTAYISARTACDPSVTKMMLVYMRPLSTWMR